MIVAAPLFFLLSLLSSPSPSPLPPPLPPPISARLSAVLSLASCEGSSDGTIADIGCDHAQLAIALLREGHAKRCIAVDRCQQPLQAGLRNAEEVLPPSALLDFRLGEGLAPLRPSDEVDTVCIAGMGARAIVKILEATTTTTTTAMDDVDNDDDRLLLASLGVRRLVLQPVSPRPQLLVPLRRFLRGHGWAVRDESLVTAGGRTYLTLLAETEAAVTSPASPSRRRDNGGAAVSEGPDGDQLLFPPTIRARAHAAMAAGAGAAAGEASAAAAAAVGDNAALVEEMSVYRDYVKLHADWSDSLRTDNYDKAAGFSQSFISSAFSAELALLSDYLGS